MLFDNNAQKEINSIIIRGAKTATTLEQIIQIEISEWQNSERRNWMKIGDKYYRNDTDIKKRSRKLIAGERDNNLANNQLSNAFIRKLVDQKVGYLLGKPLSVQTENKAYAEAWKGLFQPAMYRRLQSTGKEAINKGLAWWFVYYDNAGQLAFRKMRSEEIIPLWADEAHTVLDAVIRDYEVVVYEGLQRKTVRKIEWWDKEGVKRYIESGSGLEPDVEAGDIGSHLTVVKKDGTEQPMNWERVPFICFKYNEEEQPLVEIIKSLVDDYDRNKSDNSNNLEDLPNSIYVVKGYGGTPAGEIRKNLAKYRIIKIDDPDGHAGVDTISLEINTEAYKNHMEQARKDIYEFGRGVDTQGIDIGSAPSGVALRFLYSDLDLDASLIETEFQASLEQLRWFVDTHLYNSTGVDYSEENVSFIFNHDMPIDEESIITGIKDSVGILSDETLVAQHPYVTDVKAELKRKKNEKKEAVEQAQAYGGLPPTSSAKDGDAE